MRNVFVLVFENGIEGNIILSAYKNTSFLFQTPFQISTELGKDIIIMLKRKRNGW